MDNSGHTQRQYNHEQNVNNGAESWIILIIIKVTQCLCDELPISKSPLGVFMENIYSSGKNEVTTAHLSVSLVYYL